MKKVSLLVTVVTALSLFGCAEDQSSATREVSTPNPPVKPMTNPNAPNGNNMPDAAKDVIGKVAPGATGN
jgi:ABC-type oligopeptide transport system substrate-binding subunit